VTSSSYNAVVDTWKNPNEDERGVDIAQIRGQLKLTVAERVREMVHAANVMMTIQENARRFREMQSR
jgi:DNA polymerase II large subunit